MQNLTEADIIARDWALVNGQYVYVGAPLEDDGGRETREDRATFYDLR